MQRAKRSTVIVIGLMLLALVTAVGGHHYRLFERAWFNVQQLWQPMDVDAINLGDFRAVLQAQKIEGLVDDVSALTYDPLRKSLFTVTNKQPELIELSLRGGCCGASRWWVLVMPRRWSLLVPTPM